MLASDATPAASNAHRRHTTPGFGASRFHTINATTHGRGDYRMPSSLDSSDSYFEEEPRSNVRTPHHFGRHGQQRASTRWRHP